MSPSLDALERIVFEALLRHGAHPVLAMCASNAKASRDPAGNRKLDKERSTGRIDGLVALTMAMGAAHRFAPVTLDFDRALVVSA
jgi:phage terminase large subunit-like protein